MKPFRVTLRLLTPIIVPTTPTHLDSLLGWARVQEAEDQGEADPVSFQHDLPLERFGDGDEWCFKASWLDIRFIGNPRGFHYIRRSDAEEFGMAFEAGLFGDRKPAFDPKRGQTKAYSLIRYEQAATHVIGEGVGDIERVRQLMSRVKTFGKLRRRGKGLVESCAVEEIEKANWERQQQEAQARLEQAEEDARIQQRLAREREQWRRELQR